ARDRVADRLADVEEERVAELVGLVLEGALDAEATALDLVLAGAVLQQALEQVAEGPLADAPHSLGRELEASLTLLDEPRFLEHLGQLGQLLERRRRVFAEQLARLIEIDLGELPGLGRVAQEVLEGIDVAQLVEERAHSA